MEPITILVATGNANKVREIASILDEMARERGSALPLRLLTLRDVGFTGEIVEDGNSFEENALIKARVAAGLGFIGLADDSGLCVDALGGAPGIYSARYSGEGDAANNEKLLRALADTENRAAHYACAVACVFPDGESFTVSATCDGSITRDYRGASGFGYDPLFYVDALGKTFGEATAREKDAVSHRGKAVRAFARRFFERMGEKE